MPSPTAVPQTLAAGRFVIQRVVGQGATATVYAAFDTRLGIERAVKVLTVPAAVRQVLRSRLEAEARAMTALDHPNVLQVLDIGDDGERTWVVMRLADGGSLADQLRQHGPMPPSNALRYALQVLAALDAAHNSGVIHRDVKPHNILLDRRGTALLCDFGIALLTEEASRTTRTGVAMGSMAFMAPEQRIDARSVTPAADIYAVSATLYNLLTDANPMDLFAARPGSPRWLGVPPAIEQVLRRGSAYDPSERYQTARGMAAALVGLLEDASEHAAARVADDTLPALESTPPADAPTHPVYMPSVASTERAVEALTALPDLSRQRSPPPHRPAPPSTSETPSVATRGPSGTHPASGRPTAPTPGPRTPRLRRPAALASLALAATLAVLLWMRPSATTLPSPSPTGPVGDDPPTAATEARGPEPASKAPDAPSSSGLVEAAVSPAVAIPAVGRAEAMPSRPVPRAAPAVPSDAPAVPSDAPAVTSDGPARGRNPDPEAGDKRSDETAADAAVAPAGKWIGANQGRPIEVSISGPGSALRGVAAFKFGDRLQRIPVSGRYDPTTRTLLLDEDIDDDSRGAWRLTLSDDESRLIGTWTKSIDGSTVATALRRVD